MSSVENPATTAESGGLTTAVKEKDFTVADARRLLPWLEETFLQIEKLLERQEKVLAALGRQNLEMRSNGGGTAETKLKEARNVYEEIKQSLNDLLTSISELGILVKDVSSGLVDFPSVRDGRTVYLCWKMGEMDLSFWHETNVGFGGRQPL